MKSLPEIAIADYTDERWLETGDGPSLRERVADLLAGLTRRIEDLASAAATSRSARTEQGLPFVVYCNGAIKNEGEGRRRIMASDLSADAQLAAFRQAADETYAAIVGTKPPGADLLIWRREPEAERVLYFGGIGVVIHCRIAWDNIREGHDDQP